MPKPVTPLLAADTIIELTDFHDRPIVLIERANPPFGWAIPGGFVDVGEIVEYAAVREAKEEVCLDISLIALLGIYSDPSRDNRGHTVTAVYVALGLAIWLGAQPYRLRDFFSWLFARPGRARGVGGALAGYGLILCGVAFSY